MRSTKWILLVLLAGAGGVSVSGCFILDEVLSDLDPCPETEPCNAMGEEVSGGVRVDMRDPLNFSWPGVGADSVYVLRAGTEIWAIRPTPGSAKLASPLNYGAHPANSVSYIDSVPALTAGILYVVMVKRAGLADRYTGFYYTPPAPAPDQP